jgi:hypothetical protein
MARTSIPVTVLGRAGVAPPAQTNGDHANGMYVAGNDGTIWLEIQNTDGVSRNVGFAFFGNSVDGVAIPDKIVAVGSGATLLAGPWPVRFYGQSDGSLWVNPDSATTLKFRAFQLPVS